MTLGDFERVANELIRVKEENKELKKQLKDKTEDYKRMKDNFDSKVDVLTKIEIQQKEFIKYLEEKEKQFDRIGDPINSGACCGILTKYKEIIGVSDENSKN